MTYDTEKKNPTSHDVADTSAVSGQRVGKTRHHVVKTNCGRHLKRQHFQLREAMRQPADAARRREGHATIGDSKTSWHDKRTRGVWDGRQCNNQLAPNQMEDNEER
jgi:hypothetical protein